MHVQAIITVVDLRLEWMEKQHLKIFGVEQKNQLAARGEVIDQEEAGPVQLAKKAKWKKGMVRFAADVIATK